MHVVYWTHRQQPLYLASAGDHLLMRRPGELRCLETQPSRVLRHSASAWLARLVEKGPDLSPTDDLIRSPSTIILRHIQRHVADGHGYVSVFLYVRRTLLTHAYLQYASVFVATKGLANQA